MTTTRTKWLPGVAIVPSSDMRTAIRVAAIAASKDPTRPILCGVHFANDGKRLTIEASDAYRLHRVHLPAEGKRKWDANVPAAWLNKWAARRHTDLTIGLDFVAKTCTVTDAHASDCGTVPLIGGTFPNVEAVVPSDEHPEAATYHVDARFYADMAKAAQMLHEHGTVTVTQHPERPWDPLVCRPVGSTAELLLMPVRVP